MPRKGVMGRELLADVIAMTDLDLKIRQNDAGVDPELRRELEVARQLLSKLKSGVVSGDQSILLGDSWPLSTLGLVITAVSAVETHGIAVLYKSPEDP